jgi:FAD/FMN-containing dehydrogenase
VVGAPHVLVDPDTTAAHRVDWTGRFRAAPTPVVRPGTTDEVAALVAAAREHGVGIVAQGGNTGLVGGGVPLDGGVVLDVRRLDALVDLDPAGGQLTAGAGATIAAVQAAATSLGWAYGVDWAARDSATVGGSVATDAGGLRFIRHGSTRRQVLGVEAVLGTGTAVRHLPAVEKDNTGYRLASLLCGSEGTLGVVTAARLRLVPPRGPVATALVAFDRLEGALDAAALLRRSVRGIEALEFVTGDGLELVVTTLSLAPPFPNPVPAALLVEVTSDADPVVELAEAVTALHGVSDVAVADDEPRRRALWAYRERHTEAIARLGPVHKLDVTLPAAHLADFVAEVGALVRPVAPDASVWCFGHAGDGNVHVNLTGLAPDDDADQVVLEAVASRGGSISAEHGIGRAKRRWLHLAHGPGDLEAMRTLKRAFDPDGICNPGVLL